MAPALIALGCGGATKDPRADAPPQADDGACRAEAAAEAPPPKLHGPKERIGIVDFEDAPRHGDWGGTRDALAEAARDAATEALVKSGAFVVVEREQLAQVRAAPGLSSAPAPRAASRAPARCRLRTSRSG